MDREQLRHELAQRLDVVRARIAAACWRAGRKPAEVTLVAVTKYVSNDVARALFDLGVADLGESRPQELWAKAAALPTTVRWHQIGHLQRNKVERTIPIATLIHSIDSVRLLNKVVEEADRQLKSVEVLIEVNLSGESEKTGMAIESLEEAVAVLQKAARVRCHGLMTMAAMQEPEACRGTFAKLRTLLATYGDRLVRTDMPWQLSMGMSNDFEVAIEEGATMVRVGSCLFEGIPSEVLR